MKTEKEYNIFQIIDEYPKVGKVTIANLYAHVEIANKKRTVCATGKSKCCSKDKYDKGFGIALAYTRAVIELNKKLEKLLLEETHKPEWRKELSEEGWQNFISSTTNFNLRDIELLGEKIKKGDIIKVNIDGVKAKCKVVTVKNEDIGNYTVEIKGI